jgi:catechol 2,3-dioxygenase-like lactoylglutathione lyase family enzyme
MHRRLALVTVVVPDYDAAIAFFAGILGFRLVEDAPLGGARRWVVVSPSDGTALLLARADGAPQEAAVGNQTGGRVAFFLHTDDIERDRAAWEAAGVAFEEATRTEPYGRVAVFRDPFGNRWDLVQPAP